MAKPRTGLLLCAWALLAVRCWPGAFARGTGRFLRPRGAAGFAGLGLRAEEGSSSVKLMLNAEERVQLMDLGYSEEEAAEMRVELAQAVLARQTRRPWGERPMPEEWRDQAVKAAREADLERLQDPSGAARDSANGPDFALVVGTTVVVLLLMFAVLVVAGTTLCCRGVAREWLGPERDTKAGAAGL
eukprot:g8939.t1